MKCLIKLGLIIFLLFYVNLIKAQMGVRYQGVATNTEGVQLSQQSINVKLQILKVESPSNIVWDENHNIVTDDFGHFEVILGEGDHIGGLPSFDQIEWASNKYLLNVSLDVSQNNDYELIGSSEIKASVFALDGRKGIHARNEKQELTFDENSKILNLTGNDNTDEIDISLSLGLVDEGDVLNLLNSDGQIVSDVILDIVPYWRKGATFDFPEGLEGEYIFLFEEEYVVPTNKNLYLISSDEQIEIKKGNDFIQHLTTPNMPILKGGQIIRECKCSAILVSESSYVEPIVIDFSEILDYTVPIGKLLVIKSGLSRDDTIKLIIDGNEYKFIKPYEIRGTRIITIPEGKSFSLPPGYEDTLITAYLVVFN